MRGMELSRDDELRRAIIQYLMCHFELDKAALEREWDIRFDEYFAVELGELAQRVTEGLLELTPEFIRVTPRGRMLIRNICMVFDHYLRTREQHARYSKVI